MQATSALSRALLRGKTWVMQKVMQSGGGDHEGLRVHPPRRSSLLRTAHEARHEVLAPQSRRGRAPGRCPPSRRCCLHVEAPRARVERLGPVHGGRARQRALETVSHRLLTGKVPRRTAEALIRAIRVYERHERRMKRQRKTVVQVTLPPWTTDGAPAEAKPDTQRDGKS